MQTPAWQTAEFCAIPFEMKGTIDDPLYFLTSADAAITSTNYTTIRQTCQGNLHVLQTYSAAEYNLGDLMFEAVFDYYDFHVNLAEIDPGFLESKSYRPTAPENSKRPAVRRERKASEKPAALQVPPLDSVQRAEEKKVASVGISPLNAGDETDWVALQNAHSGALGDIAKQSEKERLLFSGRVAVVPPAPVPSAAVRRS
jgi:hypothetical protein